MCETLECNVRICEHIGISPLTKKQVKPKNSCEADHLLFCNHSTYNDGFSILKHKNQNFLLQLKRAFIMRHIETDNYMIVQSAISQSHGKSTDIVYKHIMINFI